MPVPSRTFSPLLVSLALLVLGLIVALLLRPGAPAPAEPARNLSDLGERPPWAKLADYDGVLTRGEFEAALREVYVLGPQWHCALTDEAVTIEAPEVGGQPVRFASEGTRRSPPRSWRPVSELEPAPLGQPLHGLRIAIDPGHIGGEFAKLEERWYQFGAGIPVAEGDMTLRTAKLLKPRLEALGARVTLVRDEAAPVTSQRPDDFRSYASLARPGGSEEEREEFANRLFYRTAEIRARARLVNEEIKPDLVLCLHFNAEAWGGDPANPTFSDANHFHLILNGAYMEDELRHDDERFEMMLKVFQRVHEEEAALAAVVARAFMAGTGLPAYHYALGKPARRLGPALWARNLLANRLYQCPVLFFEPYVMNNEGVYERVQAGDYDGEREVAGELRPSLYREYAGAVVQGLVDYYEPRRKSSP